MIKLKGIAVRHKTRAPMETLNEAEITVAKGITKDCRGVVNNRQITILSQESWQMAESTVGKSLPWTTRRANLLVQGKSFSAEDVGKKVHIGDVELQITRETDPCFRMDEQCEGLKDALKPDYRGGVCCIVLHGGCISVDDAVQISDQ